MGRALIEALGQDAQLHLSGALARPASSALGKDAKAFLGIESGVLITDDLNTGLAGAKVLIDFTHPQASTLHLDACVLRGIGMVIGTTGLDASQRAQVSQAAAQIPIVFSPNMSVGVNVVYKLLEVAAGALGDAFDVEILEAHHRHKRDAPSGTALRMGEVIAKAREAAEDFVVANRSAEGARRAGSIGFASLRGGDIVGDHTVLFAGSGERIEITHRSESRLNYAQGSLRAVHFLETVRNGLYTMQDVLHLG